jgi:cephalosporin-C deacetylase
VQHNFPFDPTYGYDLKSLLSVLAPEPPDDFLGFWIDIYQRTLACPANIAKRPCNDLPDQPVQAAIDVFEIEFDSLGGFRVGGWLTVPRHGRVARGIVIGHGYGGRTGPDLWHSTPPAAMLFPCARGFDRSARADLPNQSDQHVLHGIESRESYIHGLCTADLWAATSALLDLFPDLAGNIHYIGGSFGGGIGAMALPCERRISRAFLDMPSFGNHPLRVTMDCVGSGEAVRLLHARHPEILEVLRYFDAAIASRYISVPVMVSPALFDPAVPPPGQFSIFNAITAPKHLRIRQAAHFEYPGGAAENAAIDREREDWFNQQKIA